MLLRCPYCRTLIKGKAAPRCPACGKVMHIPESICKHDRKAAQKTREMIAREAERKRKALGTPDLKLAGKPSSIIFAVALLALAGTLLVSRSDFKPAAPSRTSEMKAEDDLGVLGIALRRFQRDFGRYPTTDEGLIALINNPGFTNWHRPYVNLIRKDPWRNSYVYLADSNAFVLYSAGPDRAANTSDDIHAPILPDPAYNQDSGSVPAAD